jgi:hypothetical protein
VARQPRAFRAERAGEFEVPGDPGTVEIEVVGVK